MIGKVWVIGLALFALVRTKLRYSTPDDQTGKAFTATREDTAIASTFLGTLAGKSFKLSIVP